MHSGSVPGSRIVLTKRGRSAGLRDVLEVLAEEDLQFGFGGFGDRAAVGHDGVFGGGLGGAGGEVCGEEADGGADDFLGVFGVLVHDGDDLVDGDVVVAFAPAVIVGDHGEGCVGDFGFAGEFGFPEVGHADDVGAPGAVEVGFGAGGELGAFHADVGAAEFGGDADFGAGLREGLGDEGADRVAEGDVADDPVAEEGGDPGEGAVDELVGDDEVGGFVLFLEGADGGDGEDGRAAEGFEGVDVGAEVEFGGKDAVTLAMAGEEGDLPAFEGAEDEGVGGVAEGGFEGELADVGESGHGVEAGASDDSDFYLRQGDVCSDQGSVRG